MAKFRHVSELNDMLSDVVSNARTRMMRPAAGVWRLIRAVDATAPSVRMYVADADPVVETATAFGLMTPAGRHRVRSLLSTCFNDFMLFQRFETHRTV